MPEWMSERMNVRRRPGWLQEMDEREGEWTIGSIGFERARELSCDRIDIVWALRNPRSDRTTVTVAVTRADGICLKIEKDCPKRRTAPIGFQRGDLIQMTFGESGTIR